MNLGGQPTSDTPRRLLRWTICALIVWVPIPFASVRPASVLAIQLAAAVLAAGTGLVLYRESIGLRGRCRLPLLLCGLVAAIGLLQLLPLPSVIVELLAPRTFAVRAETLSAAGLERASFEPLSLDPAATLDALLRWSAYALIGVAACVAFVRPRQILQAVSALVFSAALQALYGSAQYLSGDQRILGVPKRYFLDEATGTFVNRNHFAAYLVIALPFALGLAQEGFRALPPAGSWRQRLVRLAERRALALPGGLLATGLIWVGVVLSYSRTGLVAAALVTAFLAARSADRRARVAIVCVLLLPGAWLLSQDIRGPEERFLQGDVASIGGRLPVWRAASVASLESLALGTGLGTFEASFRLHRPASIRHRWNHAHNDWLQSLVEGGVVTTATLLALLVLILRLRRGRTGPAAWARYSAVSCSTAALIALLDFPFRIPAIAVTVSVIVGLRFAASGDAR